MKTGRILFILTALASLSVGAFFATKQFMHERLVYLEGASYLSEFGSTAAEDYLQDLAKIALSEMRVLRTPFISIYSKDDTSCSAIYQMWLEKEPSLGPWEFVVFHEAAHIACGHFEQRVMRDVSDEEARMQEKEADLLAYETLYNLGMNDIIIRRLKTLKYAIDHNFKQSDLDDHPTLQEIYQYSLEFCSAKKININ